VLQESSFTRVGGSQEVRVDVRVIAATNKDLEAEIGAGRFREDLFFRLNVIPLRVPPVAERREDVPLLVDEFIRQFAQRDGVPPKRVSAAAMAKLQAADWPGNVREIRNVVERLVVMVPDDEIEPDHLDLRPGVTRLALPAELLPLKEARARFERGYIEQVVEACGGNMSQAAKVLGLERSHLYRKLRALGVRER
jgi:two-component system nitrogen regulation response regulator NtrX